MGIEQPLRCRMGIHTGYCTVGNFGSEERMDYTIIGTTVNLAARLEEQAPPGGILISYETWAQVRDQIHCEEAGTIQVHGLPYPVSVYRAIELYRNLHADTRPLSADLPHLKLSMDIERMGTRSAARRWSCSKGRSRGWGAPSARAAAGARPPADCPSDGYWPRTGLCPALVEGGRPKMRYLIAVIAMLATGACRGHSCRSAGQAARRHAAPPRRDGGRWCL